MQQAFKSLIINFYSFVPRLKSLRKGQRKKNLFKGGNDAQSKDKNLQSQRL